MFYTVFSTNDSPYMKWQSDLLEYSWKRVGQEGALIRLVATDNPNALPEHRFAHSVATTLRDVHPDTGDAYPIYNKPASFLEWLYREKPEGTILFVDPDCVFRKPVTRRVVPGSPVSQKWIDHTLTTPSKENPFGLGSEFAFLNDHCARVDLPTDPVMIPTLIHTRDMRMICARWFELCSIIRQNLTRPNGDKVWESDMFAYLVACAEYGLRHEEASLGICTNWDPKDAPETPIIHYCQSILDKDDDEHFNKFRYEPWQRISYQGEYKFDYGRDFVSLLNDYIDEREGIVRPPSITRYPARKKGVMEGRVHDLIMLEIPDEEKSLWLNHSGKEIWEMCDGSLNIEAIGAHLAGEFGVEADKVTHEVQATVGQLHAIGFMDLR